jgi:1-deoxy-D-xylulose-5-phosphate reductoisomerase
MSGRRPRNVAILGSTGSIGRQALEVIAWHPERFRVRALAARADSPLFREQAARFRPDLLALSAGPCDWRPEAGELLVGPDALTTLAADPELDVVLVATSGTAGLRPTLAALERGAPVALANKEALVMAGHLVTRVAATRGAPILPVDSEHSGVWQCLVGEGIGRPTERVRRVTLTASGGAFRDLPREALRDVTPEDALRHPNWAMGAKITVDSATLMNKGLELIEAAWLFDLPLDRLGFVLHRESIVHALVEFVDGSVKAQLARPDMRLPILYALAYPERLDAPVQPLDLAQVGRLTFAPVDPERYPAPFLALEAGRRGQTYPAVLNAANEVAVQLFLARAIRFDQITDLVRAALDAHVPSADPSLETVLAADRWSRDYVLAVARARS